MPNVGDALEWLALLALAGAALMLAGPPAMLIVVGVGLLYLAQCYGATAMPAPRMPKFRRKQKPDSA